MRHSILAATTIGLMLGVAAVFWSLLPVQAELAPPPTMTQPVDPLTGQKLNWPTLLYRRSEAFQERALRCWPAPRMPVDVLDCADGNRYQFRNGRRYRMGGTKREPIFVPQGER